MKRLPYAFSLAIFYCLFCSNEETIAQKLAIVNQIETGFAVITPLEGNGLGLSVSEILAHEVRGNLFRSSVLPSPLVTLTSVFTRSDPNTSIETGIAIVNPNAVTATVRLTLNDQQGVTIGFRTITIEGRQQISRFVTELFFGNPKLFGPFTGLLFISADIPVGVMGLAFDGPSFTSLPVATQLNGNNLVVSGIVGTSAVVISRRPESFNAPIVNTLPVQPTPLGPMVPQTIATPLPGTIASVPSTFGGPTVRPIAGTAAPVVTTTPPQITSPSTFTITGANFINSIPEISLVTVEGQVLLPQVAAGGGWISTIAIANTSSEAILVRADFFDSHGGPLVLPFGSTVPIIRVPAGGVVTLSTN